MQFKLFWGNYPLVSAGKVFSDFILLYTIQNARLIVTVVWLTLSQPRIELSIISLIKDQQMIDRTLAAYLSSSLAIVFSIGQAIPAQDDQRQIELWEGVMTVRTLEQYWSDSSEHSPVVWVN